MFAEPNYTYMTLRDYFAAQVLNNPLIEHIPDAIDVAKACYKIADAMLEARKQ